MLNSLIYIALILIFALPTLLVLLFGQWLLSRDPSPEVNHPRMIFGLVVALLLAIPYALLATRFQSGSGGILLLIVTPALDGVLALLLINWRLVYEYWQTEKVTASLLLLALLAIIVITFFIEPGLALLLLLPPLLIAAVWSILRRTGTGWLVPIAVFLIAALWLDALGITGSHYAYSLEWLRSTYKLVSGLSAVLALALAAVFVYLAYTDSNYKDISRDRDRHSLLYITLAVLLVLSVAAVTFRHGVLTNATGRAYEDHLPFGAIAAGTISGLVLAFSLTGVARRAGVAYLLLVTIAIAVAYSLGWQVDYESLTTSRAGRLEQAIAQYYQETGSYPSDLQMLSPYYLPVFFGPLTGRGQVWCYQSGVDFYRLGYVYFQRYYDYPDDTPFWEPYYEIKVPYITGQPPPGKWICDDELRLFKQHGGL